MTSELSHLAGIVAALIVLAGTCAAAVSGPVVWTEGETYTATPPVKGKTTAKSPAISGGLGLFGHVMAGGKAAVSYNVTVPAPIAGARMIFRYQRYHWRRTMKPVPVTIRLTRGDTTVTREVSFGDTRGRGDKPAHWKILTVDLGDLDGGAWKVTLTSQAKDADVNIDGFFIAGDDFKVTTEELSSLIRLKITSDGYLGLQATTTAIRQHKVGKVSVAIRSFSDAATADAMAAIAGPDDAATPLTREAGADGNVVFALPALADGDYTLKLACAMPAATVDVPVKLIGDFMARIDRTLVRLEPVTADLAKADTPIAKRCLADFQHATGYLQAGRDVMKGAKGPEVSERKAFLAVNEGITNPAPMTVRMRRTMDQFDETMARIAAGADPYAGRRGDLRRAYRSKATGELRVYRVGVPQGYEKAQSMPLILMLHGGGGDENYFPEMDNGTIGRLANERGYLIVCPRYHTRRDKRYKADLLQMVEVARAEYPKVDPKRIYVTGISMGGFATYTLTTLQPDLFAAACCVSGTGKAEVAEALKTTPMLIIQGGRDEVIPPAGAKRVDARLTELGYPHELHMFAGNGHGYSAAPYMKLTLDWFDTYAGQ